MNLLEKYDLDKRVDCFLNEYSKDLVEANVLTDIGKFYAPRELKDFIELKASFAELRWPSAYYDHWMPHKQKQNEEAKLIFTWERFDDLTEFGFPVLNLADSDINQQVLYRIIERGGNRSGGRRGFRFAKEMKLNLILPITYAVTDYSDPYIVDFLKEASKDFSVCDSDKIIVPRNYFSAKVNPKEYSIEEETLREVLARENKVLEKVLSC